MLHLPHHIDFPHLTPPSREVALSPVPTDEDELIQAIEADCTEPWSLDPVPDTEQLTEFWSGVQEDLKHDPDWFSFTDSDD